MFTKFTFQHVYYMLNYALYFPLPSNKTAQANSQDCTKLHNRVNNEMQNVLHNKIY